MDLLTITILILFVVVFVAAYLHPITGVFVRKYFWQILAGALGLGIAALLSTLGRKKDNIPVPLDRMSKELDAQLKVIDLEAQIKLIKADATFNEAEKEHKKLSEELKEAKETSDIEERLAKLAALSNKVL